MATVVAAVERIAIELFDTQGFNNVTVEDIAASAGISVRSFYRYFATKEDVLLVRIRRSSEFLREALRRRPLDEFPMHSLRVAYLENLATEEPEDMARWIRVVASTPSALAKVMGGIQLLTTAVLRDFFAERLSVPEGSLAPSIWAAAGTGVVQAAHIHWHGNGGDLEGILSEALEVLEEGFGSSAVRPAKVMGKQKTTSAARNL